MRRLFIAIATLSVVGLIGVATVGTAAAATNAKAHHAKAARSTKAKHKVKNTDPTIYDNINDPSPGNLISLGFEATQGYEVGNMVKF